MMRWFKKDPLLHGILILLTPVFIGLFVIVSLFVYSFIQLFDPNYIEYGFQVALYKDKSCVELKKGVLDFHTPCFLARWLEGMNKNTTKALDKVVESAANQKEGLFKPSIILNGYPKKGAQWSCSANGRLIPDNSVEIIQPLLYKCWPK